jgi:integrase
MAVITKRDSGWHQAKVRRKGWPDQSKSFATKTEAQVWARQIEAGMDRGVFIPTNTAERTIFSELVKRFILEFAPHHYRATSWAHKLDHLVKHLGQYSIAAITPEVVAKYRDTRLAEPDARYKDAKQAPRVSGATVKQELDLLSKVFDVAAKEFSIPLPNGNPTKLIRKPGGATSRDYRLTGTEWDCLQDKCKISANRWLAPALILTVETAMRQGELCELKWKDVDLMRRVAILRVMEGASKLGEERAVPLSGAAIEVLKALPRHISGKVVPLNKKTLYSSFKTACRRADVPSYRWHDIRHEALSRLGDRGDFNLIEMASVSGHKTLQMLKRYTHLQAEKLALKLG